MSYLNVIIIILLLVVSIRLDGESEEVEARVVGDEDGVEAVPAVVGVGYLQGASCIGPTAPDSTYRVLKINPGVSKPREATGSDGTEPHDI